MRKRIPQPTEADQLHSRDIRSLHVAHTNGLVSDTGLERSLRALEQAIVSRRFRQVNIIKHTIGFAKCLNCGDSIVVHTSEHDVPILYSHCTRCDERSEWRKKVK